MGAVALDTSVVIGLFRPGDAHHDSARAELAAARVRGDEFVLPASVLSEAMVGGFRNGTAVDMRRRIVGLFGPVRAVDEEVAAVGPSARDIARVPQTTGPAFRSNQQTSRRLVASRG